MGKVGSTAVNTALTAYYDEKTTKLEKLPIIFNNNFLKNWGILRNYRKSEFFDDLLACYINGTRGRPNNETRLKIITLIREPIGRDIASFYNGALQSFVGVPYPAKRNIPGLGHCNGSWLPTSVISKGIRRVLNKLQYGSAALRQAYSNGGWAYNDKHIQQINNLDPKQLRDIYLEVYFHRCKRHFTSDTSPRESAIDWFDKNVKKPLSLDVYATKFPEKRAGYYHINHTDMMVLESSLDNETKEELIQDFLRIDEFKIGYENVTDRKLKALADSYALFKNEVKFPKWYLDKMLCSQYFQHFYGREDEERLRQQWAE